MPGKIGVRAIRREVASRQVIEQFVAFTRLARAIGEQRIEATHDRVVVETRRRVDNRVDLRRIRAGNAIVKASPRT